MKRVCISIALVALAGIKPAGAQFIVDHAPFPYGGPGSDTAVPESQLPWTWQLAADNFRVAGPATVNHVNWWGFHFENVAPPEETMRVRLYGARPSDGLPGEILFEETFENPERIDTGRSILLDGLPHEYRYHVALGTPMVLIPDQDYWFEVTQIGEILSGFRFEYSRVDTDGFAYRNNLLPDWTADSPTSDLAFQLVVPEPITASMLLLGLVFAAGLRARGRPNSE